MELPIKICTSQHADEVLNFYKYYACFKNFFRLKKLPTYFDAGDHPDGYVCFEYYKEQKICENNHSIVFIDALKEGWHELPSRCVSWPRDKHYFILSSAYWDIEDPDYQLPIDYTLLYFPWVLFDTVRTFTSFKHEFYFSKIEYDFNYPKQVSFCSMSAVHKKHRDYIIENLLPQFHKSRYAIKYAGQQFGVDLSNVDFVPKYSDTEDQNYFHVEGYRLFENTTGKKLQVRPSQYMPIDIYNISYYNLVAESNHEGSHFFPTEKIWRPILSGIPFVCISTQNSLKRIRDLGFRTYDTVWDESYDSIKNSQQRLEAVTKLCLELENFDWNANRDKLIEVAAHNRIQWTKVSKIFTDSFIGMENSIEQYRNSNI